MTLDDLAEINGLVAAWNREKYLLPKAQRSRLIWESFEARLAAKGVEVPQPDEDAAA